MKAGPAMELHELDLNLLVVFHQLTLERRVSRVAENLGVTQPAISNALAKLRRRFGDELFLRTPRGMEPTPFAEQLAAPVGEALALLHGGLNRRSHFDPPTAQAAVTVGMTDIGEIYFLPGLLERLRREAPGAASRATPARGSTFSAIFPASRTLEQATAPARVIPFPEREQGGRLSA